MIEKKKNISKIFICTKTNSNGCKNNIKKSIKYINKLFENKIYKKKNVLILGASAGYGLATRLIFAFGYKYNTINLFKEKNTSKIITHGWYNNFFSESFIKDKNIYSKSINDNIFSYDTIKKVIDEIKKKFIKIDIFIYSIASSKYIDEKTNKLYKTSLKPLKKNIYIKSININKSEIYKTKIQKANELEIYETKKVMGGLWLENWIDQLIKNDVLNQNFISIAYSYSGPKVTKKIYKDGTIGLAKKDLIEKAKNIHLKLKKINGKQIIVNNEAILTQSSLAIPGVPLYIAIMNKIKKIYQIKENEINQIKILLEKTKKSNNIININKTEKRKDLQEIINKVWKIIKTKNINKYLNINEFKKDYYKIYGI